jgi:2-polyprenyl-3-methyl-5-hydroxy-6-metoxy-1,4-benzoquinol methylase
MNNSQTEQNQKAWNEGAYEAWVNRFGRPEQMASKIKHQPTKGLRTLLPYMGPLEGRRVLNLLGSNGTKAVACALLGAEVSVVDFSEENKRYAEALALHADVHINYYVADVLQFVNAGMSGNCDIVFMESGILHYFIDLNPLVSQVAEFLKLGGRVVMQDFHPVSTKLITSRGTTAKIRKHKVSGDYFDTSIEEVQVSMSKYLDNDKIQEDHTVFVRKWTLGEIVTAFAQQLNIIQLEEHPNQSSDVFDKGIPKTFTLVAEKRANE